MEVAHLYKIINKITGEYYVGKHNGYEQNNYWGSGERITRQVKKYGKENFAYQILVYGSPEYIYQLEEKYVTLELIESDDKCLNLMGGGYGAKYLSEKTKQKISLSHKGKKHSLEAIEKVRKARIKQSFTKEQIEKRNQTLSSLIWMNDGIKSYRVRPENIQASKEKGLVEGRLTSYIDHKYKDKISNKTKVQWQKCKELGFKSLKVN